MKLFNFTRIHKICILITTIICFPPLLSSITGNNHFKSGISSANEAIKLVIEGAERKTVEQEWRKLMRSHGGKVSNRRRVWTSEETKISSISEQTILVIAHIDNARKGVELSVQFKHADADVSLLRDDNVKKSAEKFINDFAVNVRISTAQQMLDQAKKDLRNLEREQSKLKRDNSKLEKRIKSAEKTIQDSKKEIEVNNNTIKENDGTIKKQNDKIKDIEKDIRRLK